MVNLVAAGLLAVVLGAPVAGQDLITDRPDFTESAVVVPRGTTQIEFGATRLEQNDLEILSGPELLIRWGLSERVELRFALPDLIDVDSGPSGRGDGSIGAKIQFGPTDGGWDLGLIATVDLPVGDDEFTSDAVDPGLLVTAGRDLRGGWGLGTQLAIARQSQGADERTVLASTLVLATNLTPRVGLFVELAAEEVEGEETSLLAHHGYTFAARSNLQLDVHFGVGLTDEAPDSLVGVGVSWRH